MAVSGKRGLVYLSPWSFSRKNVAIEVTSTDKKANWYRSGYVQFKSNGLNIPNKEPIAFGRTVLFAPDFPDKQSYKIQFTPVKWLGSERLKFWEFIPTRKAVNLNSISQNEFTVSEVELIQASGLDPENLRLSPDSLELLLPLLTSIRSPLNGGILTDIKTLILDLKTMASTDIRSLLETLETVTDQTMANSSDLAAQGVELSAVTSTALVEKSFTLQVSAFALEGTVYRASIPHNLGSTSPGVAIYDNDGDLQLAEFIVVNGNNAKVELTASQRNDGSFPFTVKLQCKKTASIVGPLVDLGNGFSAGLANGVLRAYYPDGTGTDDLESGVEEAFVFNGSPFTRNLDGSYAYYQQPGFAKTIADIDDWIQCLDGVRIV